MSKLRAFIAIDLPEDVRSKTQELVRDLAAVSEGVKWVEPEKLHLTLKFLGDVDENETYHICQAMSRAVAAIEPFDIQSLGAGAFPKIERPRTLWIGVGAGSDELIALQAAIDDAMADLGYARDPKRFLPHLTLGRVKKPGRWLSDVSRMIGERAAFDAGMSPVREVVLYSSELTSEGPLYSPIGRSELG